MKKLFLSLLCVLFALGVSGCSNGGDKPKESKQEEKKKTDLEIVSEKFTLETENSGESVYGLVKDGDVVKFRMFVKLEGEDKTVADALNVKAGDLVYNVDGNDSETYLVNQNTVLVTFKEATSEDMKKSMDDYLSEKGITIDQLKTAMKEKFEVE